MSEFMTEEEKFKIALGLAPGKVTEISPPSFYEALKEPVIPKADPELVKSYDGMRVPKNARAIKEALNTRIVKHIDKAFEMKKLCTCDDPFFDDCSACEVRHEYMNDAGIDIVRMFPVQAYEKPWEIVRNWLVYCLEKELDND